MSDPRLELDTSSTAERLFSIDAFRGLTMLVMILVNDLDMADIQDVPWWLRHSRAKDWITFVDMIAPAFLFIVGVAIPLAIHRRQQKGASTWQIWRHILIRSGSLMVMGIYQGAMRDSHVHPIGMSHALWSVLMLASLILVWNDYPRSTGLKKGVFTGLRLTGMAVLVYLAIIYRRGEGDELQGMRVRWFVLGTIGWCYLFACAAFFVFRKQMAGMVGVLALLIALSMGDRAGVFNEWHFLDGIRRYVSFGRLLGSHAPITVAGAIVGMLFMDGSPAPMPRKRIVWIVTYGLLLLGAGFLLRPYYELSVVNATPTWSLYSCAACCFVFVFLYWLTDMRRLQRWASFALPAARNPLLPYFLHYMIHPLSVAVGAAWLNEYLNAGPVGIVRTVIVTIFLGVILTSLLSRLHVRPRL